MTDEPFSSEDDRGVDGGFDTTSGGLNDETAVSVRAARAVPSPPAAPAAAGGDADADVVSAAGDETTSTVRVDRAPRPAVPRYAAPPELPDDTVVRPRTARIPDEATIRVRRTVTEPAQPIEADEPGETDGAAAADAEASIVKKPARIAYSPDPDELAAGYTARPATPFIGARAAHPMRMAQPQMDGEAIDRSVRGRARRRAISLGAAVAITVAGAACLLAALIASLGS